MRDSGVKNEFIDEVAPITEEEFARLVAFSERGMKIRATWAFTQPHVLIRVAPERVNKVTGEKVLGLDHRGREAAARELRELRSMDWEVRKRWSSDGLRDRAEDFARHVWTLSGSPEGWDVTIERDCPRGFPGWEMVRGEWRKAS